MSSSNCKVTCVRPVSRKCEKEEFVVLQMSYQEQERSGTTSQRLKL